MIIDYSTARPSLKLLGDAGVTAVGRYIGWDSVSGYHSIGKNITREEASSLLGAGIEVFLFFEYGAQAASKGYSQGHADAELAISQLHDLGAPEGITVYFAVDYDAPDFAPSLPNSSAPGTAKAKLGPIAEYFRGINEAQPAYKIGAYGGYWVVKRLMDAGLVDMICQTEAWSGGNVDSRAVLVQKAGGVPSALSSLGVDIDVLGSAARDGNFGQWKPIVPKPVAKRGPVPSGSAGGYPMMLTMQKGIACVLPVPEGKSKIILYADSLGVTNPKFRIGFGPAWSKLESQPSWDSPAVHDLPPGAQRVTISRLDDSAVPVTVDFALFHATGKPAPQSQRVRASSSLLISSHHREPREKCPTC